jgi:hypothetical protein
LRDFKPNNYIIHLKKGQQNNKVLDVNLPEKFFILLKIIIKKGKNTSHPGQLEISFVSFLGMGCSRVFTAL